MASFAVTLQALRVYVGLCVCFAAQEPQQGFLSPTKPPRVPLENKWRMSDKTLWEASPAFKIFDSDENEVLSRGEILDGSNMANKEAYQLYVQDFDDDRDGFVSVKEFDRDPTAAFRLLDMDGSNKINSYELIENGNLDLNRAEKYIKLLDKDGDDKISLEEYKKGHGSDRFDKVTFKALKAEKSEIKQHDKNIAWFFSQLDADKDGALNAEEIRIAGGMNSEKLRNFYKDFDLDKNGKLDSSEFLQNTGARSRLFDQNDSGGVSATEVATVAGVQAEDAQGFFQERDEDENGVLSEDELNLAGLANARAGKKGPQRELEGIRKDKAPQEDVAPSSAAFKMLDVDESTQLTPFELIEAAKFTKPQVLEYFAKYDTNKNSQISSTEFERHAAAAFEAYDTDRNGEVSQKELMEVNNLKKATAAAYIQRFDNNGDGVISAEEFKKSAMPPADAKGPGTNRGALGQVAVELRKDLRKSAIPHMKQTIKDFVDTLGGV